MTDTKESKLRYEVTLVTAGIEATKLKATVDEDTLTQIRSHKVSTIVCARASSLTSVRMATGPVTHTLDYVDGTLLLCSRP